MRLLAVYPYLQPKSPRVRQQCRQASAPLPCTLGAPLLCSPDTYLSETYIPCLLLLTSHGCQQMMHVRFPDIRGADCTQAQVE